MDMLTYTKTYVSIAKIRLSSKLAAVVLEMIGSYVKPGITPGELDAICFSYITKEQKATPACLGYYGFPKSICISINEVVCHGIPTYTYILKRKDIVNIDVAVLKDGFYGDSSKMFYVEAPDTTDNREFLCKVVQECLYIAIRYTRADFLLRTIGKGLQTYVEGKGFSTVKSYCGHGIGERFHEEPQIPHYNELTNGIVLKEDMVFTIEPMVNTGVSYTYVGKDGWSVRSKDHSPSAQYEHTILVTKDGCEVLSLRTEEPLSRYIHNL